MAVVFIAGIGVAFLQGRSKAIRLQFAVVTRRRLPRDYGIRKLGRAAFFEVRRKSNAPEILGLVMLQEFDAVGIDVLHSSLNDNSGTGSGATAVLQDDHRFHRQITLQMNRSSVTVEVGGGSRNLECRPSNILARNFNRDA